MDYSLLLGIHDCSRADESHDSPTEGGSRPENSDSGEECDSGGDRFNYNTPPDSPRCIEQQGKDIIPDVDIYAIASIEGNIHIVDPESHKYLNTSLFTENREIYFIAIIDVLTHYGVKKQVSVCLYLFLSLNSSFVMSVHVSCPQISGFYIRSWSCLINVFLTLS